MDVIWGFAKTQFLRHLAYPGDFWMAPIARLAAAFALIGFWNAVYAAGVEPGGMTREMMLAWAGAAIVLARLVAVDITEDIAERIRRGDIVFEVMRPTDFQPQAFGTWLGRLTYTILVDSFPIAIVIWGIARVGGPPDFTALLLAAVSLVLSMVIAFLLTFCAVLIGFWTIQVETWTWILGRLVQLSAGFFVPLWLLPDVMREVLQYLPFAMLYHAPLSAFVGRVEGVEALRLIAVQTAWVPVLFLVTRWLMGEARRRVLIQGG